MENLSKALYLAFAMIIFVIAFSVSLFLVDKLNTTAKSIVYRLDYAYYDSLSLDKLIENNEDRNRSRIVGVDTIIPTLYRYYKESFAVEILDSSGNLLQYFDTTTEGDVNAAVATIDKTNKQRAILKAYNQGTAQMFGAPWLANIDRDAKTRVDMYISGKKGYINNVLVDYTGNNLKSHEGSKFKEIFTQYAYEGDTISSNPEDGGEIISLTGNKQIATKIIIIYKEI